MAEISKLIQFYGSRDGNSLFLKPKVQLESDPLVDIGFRNRLNARVAGVCFQCRKCTGVTQIDPHGHATIVGAQEVPSDILDTNQCQAVNKIFYVPPKINRL